MTSRAARHTPGKLRLRGYARQPAAEFSRAHAESELRMLEMSSHILRGIMDYGFLRGSRRFKVVMTKGSGIELLKLVSERLSKGKLSDEANSNLMIEAAMVEASNKGLVCLVESRHKLAGNGNPHKMAQAIFVSLVCNGYSEKNDDGQVAVYSIEIQSMEVFMKFLRDKAKAGAFSDPQNLNSDLGPVLKEAVENGLVKLKRTFSVPNSPLA